MNKKIYVSDEDKMMQDKTLTWGQSSVIKKPLSEYDTVKEILIKHNALHLDIDQIDDTILMEDLYKHFQEEMPYGTQKARTGDPDEYIYDKLEDLGLPLGEQQL